VYKNGKAGMLSTLTETIIPAEYDMIVDNGLHYSMPRKSEFVILKKNGLYGVTEIKFNRELKKHESVNTIQPVFNHIPAFYINDYYNIQGLRLYGLYDQDFKFLGYADKSGRKYYKD
jgi:hypothetical protein